MNLAVLTSGGDCPGLNAVIRAIVRSALPDKIKVTGIIGGWEGIWKGEYVDLNMPAVAGIINRGGTILGTSRFSPFEQKNGKKILLERLSHKKFRCDYSNRWRGVNAHCTTSSRSRRKYYRRT